MNTQYKSQETLKPYTTLKIGGPADRFYEPASIEEMQEILAQAKQEHAPLFVLGNGSNVLFEDEGYRGWIIHLSDNWNGLERLPENQVRVKAGTTNEEMAQWLAQNGLGGYEFASGIPGTVGGAIVMNAGAYNGETKDVLKSVRWLDEQGNLQESAADELDLSYRHSLFSDQFGLVVDAIYQFAPEDSALIWEKMQDLHDKRWSKQPMDKASAGSTFKRPANSFASKLIHECGLQGLSVGDAMVSTKHAGFLINDGNASAAEFLELVEQVKKAVKDQTGIELEMEIRHITNQPDQNGSN